MRFDTALGTLVVETDWQPLLSFIEAQRQPFPPVEDREVVLRVEVVPRSEIGDLTFDPPDAYPRRVCVDGCAFTFWRERVEGLVPSDLAHVGAVVEWLWYALAVCCSPPGWEGIHAAATDGDDGVTLFFGAPGTGKTRAALDAMACGHRFFSDDVVLVNTEGAVARSWGATMHVDPRAARQAGHATLTPDFGGKVRIPPPSPARRNEAPIARVLSTGGDPSPIHGGAAFDSSWAAVNGVGAKLLARAKPVPRTVLSARVAITNRNPWREPTRW